jgi:DNA-binding transcriptional regulator YdaS (Cro superfamily)
MKLSQWIEQNRGTVRQIANGAGVHYATAWKWVHGVKIPNWKHIPAIERVTGGNVTAEDFVPKKSDGVPATSSDAPQIEAA